MSNESLWPLTFAEMNVGEPDAGKRILPEDIASYAYPPERRERYTESGLKKAQLLGIVPLDVRDFGAIADSPD